MPLVNIQDKFIVRSSSGGGISAPSNVAISNKSSSGFTVSWNSVASALGYKLDVATDSGFTSFVSGYNGKDVAGTSQAVTGLSPNTTYYTRVRAVAASSNSSSVSDTTETATLPLNVGLRNGLQAFYKLDDTTDASGNGNALTNTGGVTFSSGKIGNAAVFNGTDRLYSTFNNIPTTVSLWFKGASFGGYKMLFSAIDNGSLAYLVQGQGNGTFRFYSQSGSIVNSNTTVDDDNWHHIVSIVSGGTISLYVDGVLDVSDSGSTGAFGATDIGIGCYPNNNDDRLTGQIDAVGVWDRALTETEIGELYNSGSGLE